MAIRTSTLSRAVVLLTAVAVVYFLLLASAVGAGDREGTGEVHVIQAGETLWSIASERTPSGGDIRRTVYDIKRMNGIEGSTIQAGSQLLVPAG